MKTKLVEIRSATPRERKEHGAEVIFVREGRGHEKHTIYGATCYESWQQWGASREILGDNVSVIEHWRKHGLSAGGVS